MVRKILVLAASLVVLVAAPAAAGDGYADEDTLVLSDSTVAPGGSFTASIEVCQVGSSAGFSIDGQSQATATADGSGQASASLTAPDQPGNHTVGATCPGADGGTLVLSSTLTVTGASGATGPLPSTGSDGTAPMTKVALAAIAGGGLLVILANQRRGAKRAARETAGV